MNIDVEETDIKNQMELCKLQASEFYNSKKETGAYLFKMFPKKHLFTVKPV